MKNVKKNLLAVAFGLFFANSVFAATPPDTFVVAKNIEDIVSLDPAEAFEFSGGEVLANVYQGLVQYDVKEPTKVLPAIASSWEVAADGKSINFTLNADKKFSTGNPVRPEDVLFSYRRVLVLEKAPASILSQLGWTKDNIEQHIKITSPNTLTLSWDGDFGAAYVLNVLAARPGGIVDEVEVMKNAKNDDLGNQWLNTHSAGSGAYLLKLYKPKEVVILEQNPNATTAPKLAKVLIKNVSEPATQRLLLESNDADLVRDLGSDQLVAIEKNSDIRVEDYPTATVHFLALNQKNEKLQNPAVWEAVRYLINYDSISNELLKGKMKTHQTFLPEGFIGSINENPYKLDVEKAKAILAEAGVKDLELKLDLINSPLFMDMAQSIQATMADAGIKVTLNPGTGSQILTRYRAREHDAILLYWAPDFFDPHSNAKAFAFNIDNSDAAYQSTTTWRNAWHIPELSEKTMQALREKESNVRADMYKVIQTEVQQKSPIIITFQEQNRVAMRNNVQGYVQGSVSDLVFYDQVTK